MEKGHNLVWLHSYHETILIVFPLYFDLSELFPVQFGRQVNQMQMISHVHHSHPELIMGDRVKCSPQSTYRVVAFSRVHFVLVLRFVIWSLVSLPCQSPPLVCLQFVSVFTQVLSGMIRRRSGYVNRF